MCQATIPEIPVSGEEGRAFEAVEDLEDVLITGTAMRHSRSRQISVSEMFSSVVSIWRENAFVTEEVAGQFHGFRDRPSGLYPSKTKQSAPKASRKRPVRALGKP